MLCFKNFFIYAILPLYNKIIPFQRDFSLFNAHFLGVQLILQGIFYVIVTLTEKGCHFLES